MTLRKGGQQIDLGLQIGAAQRSRCLQDDTLGGQYRTDGGSPCRERQSAIGGNTFTA
jgi:hypothetical protein